MKLVIAVGCLLVCVQAAAGGDPLLGAYQSVQKDSTNDGVVGLLPLSSGKFEFFKFDENENGFGNIAITKTSSGQLAKVNAFNYTMLLGGGLFHTFPGVFI